MGADRKISQVKMSVFLRNINPELYETASLVPF